MSFVGGKAFVTIITNMTGELVLEISVIVRSFSFVSYRVRIIFFLRGLAAYFRKIVGQFLFSFAGRIPAILGVLVHTPPGTASTMQPLTAGQSDWIPGTFLTSFAREIHDLIILV